jgi:long-chain acyl-CoA synthetase
VVLMERFAADEALALIARHHATMFEGVPAMYAMLLACPALDGADLTSGSIGVALPGIGVRVADLDDVARDAPPGVPGELMVRGPIVMMGYLGNPGETARTIEADARADLRR